MYCLYQNMQFNWRLDLENKQTNKAPSIALSHKLNKFHIFKFMNSKGNKYALTGEYIIFQPFILYTTQWI